MRSGDTFEILTAESADGSILNLIRTFLESGVLTNEGWEASERGSPQGGGISPLIANVYLDEFDQFMKERKLRIIRYADDIVIVSRSISAAATARQTNGAVEEAENAFIADCDKWDIEEKSKRSKWVLGETPNAPWRIWL